MQLFEIQFAWFFKEGIQLDFENLVSLIRQKTKRQFISPATYIPLPLVAPPEIPRAQLQNIDNSSRFTIALNRADFFVSSINATLEPSDIESFYRDLQSFSEILLSKIGISRLGLVGRMCKLSTDPASEISSSLLKYKSDELFEASIKFVERHVAERFTYNDSFQFDQGIKLDTQQKILLVTRDINTVPEIPLTVSLEIITCFCSLAKERLDKKYINKVMGA